MANTGKRNADNHGEMVSLCEDKITIRVFQKLMMESATEKTSALKSNNADFVFHWEKKKKKWNWGIQEFSFHRKSDLNWDNFQNVPDCDHKIKHA